MDGILVSISCLTYNHKEYIRNALDGFINQRTTFGYEVIIHDDASDDGTVEILKEYENKYPELFRVFYEEQNKYSTGEIGEILQNIDLNETRGRYIAYCEGDDYWIDNNKLQFQVDYMEKHPECSMTGHNVLIRDMKKGIEYPMDGFFEEVDVTAEDIIRNNRGAFQTSSFLIRKDVLPYYYKIQGDCTIGDWPLKLVSSACGRIHYFDRLMSVYRYCHSGAWSDSVDSNSVDHMRYRINMVRYFDRFNEFTNEKYVDVIEEQKEAFLDTIVSYNRYMDDIQFNALCDFFAEENSENLSYIPILKDKKRKVGEYDEKMKTFANRYKYIYVMGTGQYAEELVRIMDKNELDFEGFVVSNNQPLKSSFMGKSVNHLKDIIALGDEVGILIGIKKNLKDLIESSLKENNISNYYWPML